MKPEVLISLKVFFAFLIPAFYLQCTHSNSEKNLDFILGILNESGTGVFFDDFSYNDRSSASATNGWIFRSVSGGPGPAGASWDPGQITFGVEGADTYLRLSAVTQGSVASTIQSEFSTGTQKFFRGTYASRIRFFNSASSGATLDRLNQTFFAITPLVYDGDPNYSECDFEYLGQGGWGKSVSTMFLTTWETYNPNTNFYDDISDPSEESLDGWHVLIMQVSEFAVKYYIDGDLIQIHGGKYVPETPMTINFNLWFLSDVDGLDTTNTGYREYEQRIDWVYFVKNRFLSPQKLQEEIDSLRVQNIASRDTVP